jgi:putative hydrolase of the HAD superfamily
MRKPNPRIYKLLIKKMKLVPSEIIFIDNQIWNINPAKKIGMQTILFKNNKQLFENKIWRSLFEVGK